MKTMQFGEHITIDGYKGNRKSLDSRKTVMDLLLKLPEKLGMKILQRPSVVLAPDNGMKDPGGWTGFVIIAESHISIHTFPQRGFVSADIYTCKSGMDTQTIVKYFTDTFKLMDIETNFIKRGTRYPVENIKEEINSLEPFIAFNKANVFCASSPLNYGQTYFAKKNFKKGSTVMQGFGKLIPHQTKHYSVQISSDQHFMPQKWTGKYWNHSCEPNCFVQTRADGFPNLLALKDIKQSEEIVYGYFMTEYEWCKEAKENYIPCKCKTKNCKGKILSFSQLTKQQQTHFRKHNLVSKYLIA